MEANIEEPMSLDDLAASIGVSRRQIERLFKRHLDQVPTKYYLRDSPAARAGAAAADVDVDHGHHHRLRLPVAAALLQVLPQRIRLSAERRASNESRGQHRAPQGRRAHAPLGGSGGEGRKREVFAREPRPQCVFVPRELAGARGAAPSRSRDTTWSSSAAAGTGSRPPTTSPRSTASPTSPCSRKAGSAAATPGRNTTIVRSNYLWDEATHLYEHSLKLWEGLSQDLNFNVMFSQRGVLNLGHTLQDMRDIERRVNANRLNGIDARVLDAGASARRWCPIINFSPSARYPILGACCSGAAASRATTPSPGASRAAPTRSASTSSRNARSPASASRRRRRCAASRRRRGFIGAEARSASSPPGHSSVLAAMAGLRLPIESHPLQALVSEPIKPVLDTVVMSNAVHVYISQSDKGELVIGAGIDSLQLATRSAAASP